MYIVRDNIRQNIIKSSILRKSIQLFFFRYSREDYHFRHHLQVLVGVTTSVLILRRERKARFQHGKIADRELFIILYLIYLFVTSSYIEELR